MIIYFAPMEGVTNFIFRGVYSQFYKEIDKYYTPFISANEKGLLGPRDKREILKEHNEGINLIPQILTSNSSDFIKTTKTLKEYGYKEFNLNLGCPSATVVSKGKGSGMLQTPLILRKFLDDIFKEDNLEISIKTRIGFSSGKEMGDLLKIFNDYPLKELIVHPRVREDFYKNTPDLAVFSEIVEKSKNSICYNGDLFNVEQIKVFNKNFPTVEKIMIGRGLVTNPGLIREYRTGQKIEKKEFKIFHDQLFSSYSNFLSGDRNLMFKMKEYWKFWNSNFPENRKQIKKIQKSQSIFFYNRAVEKLFE